MEADHLQRLSRLLHLTSLRLETTRLRIYEGNDDRRRRRPPSSSSSPPRLPTPLWLNSQKRVGKRRRRSRLESFSPFPRPSVPPPSSNLHKSSPGGGGGKEGEENVPVKRRREGPRSPPLRRKEGKKVSRSLHFPFPSIRETECCTVRKKGRGEATAFFAAALNGWGQPLSLSLSKGKEEKDKKGKIKFISAVVTFPPPSRFFSYSLFHPTQEWRRRRERGKMILRAGRRAEK